MCTALCLAAAGLVDQAGAQTVTGRTDLATWMSNGPFGGVVEDLEVDPNDPSVVYAATRGGVFKSVDGASTWSARNQGLTNISIRGVAVSPFDPSLVFAGSSEGLFRSQDAGATWSEVALDPSRPHFHDTFYEIDFSATGSTIFALGGYDIYRSDDGGTTWSVIHHQEPETMETLTVAPGGNTIYVGGQQGLRVSNDQGSTWRLLPIPGAWVSSVIVDPHDPSVVFAEAAGGLYKSVDRGTTWSRLLPDAYVYEVASSPAAPNTVYVVGQVTYAVNRVALYVARSDDAGATWVVETRMPSDSLRMATIAVDPSSPDVLYIGTGGRGVFKSSDGATTFDQKVEGLTAATPRAVAVDPNDPGLMYAGLLAGDSFRSEDAGASWTRIPSGPGDPEDPYLPSWINHFVITSDSTVYAAGGSGDVYSSEARVFKSTDRGDSWVAAAGGLPAHHRVADLIETEPGVLVAGLTRQMALNEGGIYKTTDGGSVWVDISPTAMATRGLAYDRRSGTLYALVGEGSSPYQSSLYSSRDGGETWRAHVLSPLLHDPGTVAVGRLGQVFLGSSVATQIGVSHDFGLTWAPIQVASNRSGHINDIAQDPLDPTQLFVATGGGGIWVSKTAGITWSQMVPDVFGVDAHVIVFGPKTSGVIDVLPDLEDRPLYAAVAGGAESGVWQVFPEPHAVKSPLIEGNPRPGRTLRCVRRWWSRSDSFRYRWQRDGASIPNASGRRYNVRRADQGHSVSCRVRALGPGGSATKTSPGLKIRR